MTDLYIFGHHTKLFVFSASVFSIYMLLFLTTTIASYVILKPHREFTGTNEVGGMVYAISCLTFQNNSVVYMLSIFLICFRMNLVNRAMEKLVKNRGSDENVVEHLKAYANLFDVLRHFSVHQNRLLNRSRNLRHSILLFLNFGHLQHHIYPAAPRQNLRRLIIHFGDHFMAALFCASCSLGVRGGALR